MDPQTESGLSALWRLRDSRAWEEVARRLAHEVQTARERIETHGMPIEETEYWRGYLAALNVSMKMPDRMVDEFKSRNKPD